LTRLEITNLVLAIFGILVSLAGFGITLYQLRRTRTVVEAAEAATTTALASLSARLTISELADMRGGLRAIQTALRGARYETALLQTQPIIEQLHGLRSRTGFDSDERHMGIQDVVVQLAKLRNRLELKIAVPETVISVPKANNLLSELGSTLSVWSEELRFTIEREES
jgi:hypothetical protein